MELTGKDSKSLFVFLMGSIDLAKSFFEGTELHTHRGSRASSEGLSSDGEAHEYDKQPHDPETLLANNNKVN